jgi:hypothetical protein
MVEVDSSVEVEEISEVELANKAEDGLPKEL